MKKGIKMDFLCISISKYNFSLIRLADKYIVFSRVDLEFWKIRLKKSVDGYKDKWVETKAVSTQDIYFPHQLQYECWF